MTKTNINKLISIIAIMIVIGSASFYAGMRYERSNSTNPTQGGGFASMTQEERQARMANGGLSGGQRMGGTRTNGGGLMAGEIIAKDATSITIKLRDGGSKIAFLSDATKIMKSVDGSTSDLMVGAQVTTIGTANADGSMIAQSVQLRNDIPKQN